MKAYEGVPRGRNQGRYAREKLRRRRWPEPAIPTRTGMPHPSRPKPSKPQAQTQDAPTGAPACFGLGHVGSRLPRGGPRCVRRAEVALLGTGRGMGGYVVPVLCARSAFELLTLHRADTVPRATHLSLAARPTRPLNQGRSGSLDRYLNCTTGRFAPISVGPSPRFWASPRPSCPRELLPQHLSVPSSRRAHV
jgi:hypothetical protein